MANFKSYEYNEYRMWREAGQYTWTKPDDLDDTKPILVHVWGAGGVGGNSVYTAGDSNGTTGGGGGGLAVKLIDVANLGATETITIGAGSVAGANTSDFQGTGGTSSFGSHCSATGGNDGYNNDANEGSATTYGVGGIGLQGDVNKRGGSGGSGYYSTATNCGGGGGGSAPAPYGVSDGFNGGNGYTYSGGGGGGIGGMGLRGNYQGGAGGSSMQTGYTHSYGGSTQRRGSWTGMPGIGGAGGHGACVSYGYTTYGGTSANVSQPPKGTPMLLNANDIFFCGGSSAGSVSWVESSAVLDGTSGGAAPGAGGGGSGSNTTTNYYAPFASDGGILGGGGGSRNYSCPGYGGNGGGSGASGYQAPWSEHTKYKGGDGLVIIQYARKI